MTQGMARIVARNRRDLERALSPITSELLKEKGYLCFVDIFMKLGYLSQGDYEHWRLKRVPYLERVLTLNLPTIHFVMQTVRRKARFSRRSFPMSPSIMSEISGSNAECGGTAGVKRISTGLPMILWRVSRITAIPHHSRIIE